MTDIESVQKFSKKFKDKIIFEYFSQYSVISSSQENWFEKFVERNPGNEFRGDLKRFHCKEMLFFRQLLTQAIMLWVVSWGLIFFIELGFEDLINPFIWITLCFLGVFLGTGIYWDVKKVRLKVEIYFRTNS